MGLVAHARNGSVKWRCAAVFAAAGAAGALAGSTLGKMIPGESLLAAFAILMLTVAASMVRKSGAPGREGVRLGRENLVKLLALGFGAGALSGFFGIGGGFLIVPGLMLATGMPILNAVASSLPAVMVFGATAGANYAVSGLVDWSMAFLFLAGGIAGGFAGSVTAARLAPQRGILSMILAAIIASSALYILARSLTLL
jgi:hypothetical protein